ncbi:branched-chain amino acid ABC transporter permease [Ferrovibrio xuzhouensis]|uniref:Branched-chain amino acid ABC transporter permease n=1 Tax=Ferrovibrio xuzhouensis TaxID=1576914 RepID=A0ABV7VLC7_9PROT
MKSIENNTLAGGLILALALPLIVPNEFLIHVMIMVFFYGILASSLNLTVGYVGELPLGHAAFLGIGAYTSAILSAQFHAPFWLALPVAGVIAALFGLAIGAITLRLEGHYFVLITLSFTEVMRLIVLNWVEVTRGPLGFSNIPAPVINLGAGHVYEFNSKLWYYYLGLALLAVTTICVFRFARSSYGAASVAIRENRRLAKSIGINPFRYALGTFVAGAFFAGLAGSFYAHYISFVGPEVFGFSFMVTMLMMVALGGKGTVLGPILGALVIGLALEYLRFINEVRLSVFGLLLIAVVVFLPNGITGLLLRRRRGVPAKVPQPKPAES